MTARPERVPAEEVRRRMLDAGRELAVEAGAALTIEHLRLEEVIQRARVPRSSVYRLWAYRDEYIDDLLCHLAGAGSLFGDRTVFDPSPVGSWTTTGGCSPPRRVVPSCCGRWCGSPQRATTRP